MLRNDPSMCGHTFLVFPGPAHLAHKALQVFPAPVPSRQVYRGGPTPRHTTAADVSRVENTFAAHQAKLAHYRFASASQNLRPLGILVLRTPPKEDRLALPVGAPAQDSRYARQLESSQPRSATVRLAL